MTYDEFIQNIIDTRGQWNTPDGEYKEMHHIIPRCLGGTGDCKNGRFNPKSHHKNCIWLLAEEHYEAHRLLAFENPTNKNLIYAYWAMSTVVDPEVQERYKLTADEYAEIKKLFHNACSGINSKMYGTHLTEAQKLHLSITHKGQGLGNIYVYKDGLSAKSIKPELLDNYIADGWLLGNGQKGKVTSDEIKTLISQRTKEGMKKWREEKPEEYAVFIEHAKITSTGRTLSEAAKQKISKKNSGENNGMYKNGLSTEDYRLLHNMPIQKVLCVELNIVYYSVTDAAKAMGIGRSHISRCCLHRYGFKTAGGYHWEFIE